MRVAFIGSTKRGYQTLQALIRTGVNVVGVLSLEQDAHELERYEEPIRALADQHGIPLVTARRIKGEEHRTLIANTWRADVAIVVGCRVVIPREVYSSLPHGCLAVHDSLLPDYRGFAPLNWSIINGESHTGVTLLYLNELVDGGDIVEQSGVPIGPTETAAQVYERVCTTTARLVCNAWPALERGDLPRRAQDYASGTFTCSRIPEDGWIDWKAPTATIFNLVRALSYPYPGAVTLWEGKRLIVCRSEPSPDPRQYAARIPGRVVRIDATDGWVDVLTGDGVLRVYEVEQSSGGPQPAASIIRSIRGTLGSSPLEMLARVERLEARLEAIERLVLPESTRATKGSLNKS